MTSNIKSAVIILPRCWNCPHTLYRPGLVNLVLKDTAGPPLQSAWTSSLGWTSKNWRTFLLTITPWPPAPIRGSKSVIGFPKTLDMPNVISTSSLALIYIGVVRLTWCLPSMSFVYCLSFTNGIELCMGFPVTSSLNATMVWIPFFGLKSIHILYLPDSGNVWFMVKSLLGVSYVGWMWSK